MYSRLEREIPRFAITDVNAVNLASSVFHFSCSFTPVISILEFIFNFLYLNLTFFIAHSNLIIIISIPSTPNHRQLQLHCLPLRHHRPLPPPNDLILGAQLPKSSKAIFSLTRLVSSRHIEIKKDLLPRFYLTHRNPDSSVSPSCSLTYLIYPRHNAYLRKYHLTLMSRIVTTYL